ncbi:MAG: hypothetical protein DIU62_000405 [Pseudomonadota bacterium]|jgi:Tol biopolymer transport system component|nr:MAG: hypothetical protein DIU62_15720 [Pseudomonadota bacterium]
MKRLAVLVAGMAAFSLAHAAAPQSSGGEYELALVDLQGQKKVLGTLPDSVYAPRVSPDGTRVAFELTEPGESAGDPPITRIQVAPISDLAKRRALQVTVITRRNIIPVWNPESDRIAFLATGNGSDALFWQRADGGEQPKFLVDGAAPEGIYRDGRMLFATRAGERDYGIAALDLTTLKVTPVVDLPGTAQHSSHVSADGRWIAYASDETGRYEVWAEPLPQTGRRFQLTRGGGAHPVWAPDGRALYFDQGGKLYRLDVTAQGDELRVGAAVELPITGFVQGPGRRQYDLAPDGRSFLMLFPAGGK